MLTKKDLLDKLDFCPYCGESGKNLKVNSYFDKMSKKRYYIECKCGATSKEIVMEPSICVYEELLNFWNTRYNKNNDLAIDGRNKDLDSFLNSNGFLNSDVRYFVNDD